MAIADNYVPIHQAGNGATTAFSASWNMIAAAYAAVYLEDAATGVQTQIFPGPGAGQYSITINSGGFTVTYGTAPAVGKYAVIGRSVTLDQTDPYRTSKGYQGEVLESSLDKLTAVCQDTIDIANRSLTFPLGDTTSTILPPAAVRANMALLFDSLGAPFVGAVTGTAISAAMIPVVQASSIANARVALGGVSTLTGVETFTNKTLTAPVLNNPQINGTPTGNWFGVKPIMNHAAGFVPSSIAGTSTTASMTFSQGQVCDSTNATYISIAGSTNWSVTNGNAINGYSGGTTLPNSTTIHFFACTGTSGSGVFASNSLTPTFPTGYNTYSRRIFSHKTNSSGAFQATPWVNELAGGGLSVGLDPALDINVANLGSASRTLYTLPVPTGFKVQVSTRMLTGSSFIAITSGDDIDRGPSNSSTIPAVPLFDFHDFSASPGFMGRGLFTWTNTSGQIGARCDTGAANTLGIVTLGWIDHRRS